MPQGRCRVVCCTSLNLILLFSEILINLTYLNQQSSQSCIYNPAKHLRWKFLAKIINAFQQKGPIVDDRLGSKYTSASSKIVNTVQYAYRSIADNRLSGLVYHSYVLYAEDQEWIDKYFGKTSVRQSFNKKNIKSEEK